MNWAILMEVNLFSLCKRFKILQLFLRYKSGRKFSPMGNGLMLYQGALLHEQFVALVTLEPLEDICFMSELLY